MGLGGQVVDLVGPDLLDDADQVGGVRQVAVVQEKAPACCMGVLVEVIDAVGVEERGPALDPVHLVALAQQEFRQIRPVLSGHAGDKRLFHLSPDALRVSAAQALGFPQRTHKFRPFIAGNRHPL